MTQRERVVDTPRGARRGACASTWPRKPPTHGIEAHNLEALDFFRAFPDQELDNRPYRVFFASGEVQFCTVARWGDDGRIIEENLFYDLGSFLQQIGLGA